MHRPCKLTFDLLILKVMSESRVMWASSANFSLPRPLLLISKTAKLHAYIRQNVDIIPVSSVNVIKLVFFIPEIFFYKYLRQKPFMYPVSHKNRTPYTCP